MIFLDANSTAPLRREVWEAMSAWVGVPANPSSAHALGRRAAAALEDAREAIAAAIQAPPADLVFTSGATEANHLALRGAASRWPGSVAISPLSHPSTVACAALLEAQGTAVARLAVDAQGRALARVDEGVTVVATPWAEGEAGVLQPIEALAERARTVVDATQAVGRVPVALGPHAALTLSSHKLGGPPGVGAAALAGGRAWPALFPGAQERGRRGGTVPVALAVGFAVAVRAAMRDLEAFASRARAQQAQLAAALGALGGRILGAEAPRLPNTTAVVFDGLRGDLLVAALDLAGVAASAGSACASGSAKPAAILTAIGDPEPSGLLRLSTGPWTTDEEVERAVRAVGEAVRAAREVDLG